MANLSPLNAKKRRLPHMFQSKKVGLQTNTELSNAIENRDDPSYVEDIAREKLGLVAPNDRVFNIAD